MQLFYIPSLEQDEFTLSEEESRHCTKVLRKKKGDTLTLIDGRGTEAKATITEDHPKKCSGVILSRTIHTDARSCFLHLAIAPTKNFDRMEWLLEKTTEIGVSEISFIETQHSERNRINIERCHKILVSAIKQSQQYHLPILHPLRSLDDFLKDNKVVGQKYIAWCGGDPISTLTHYLKVTKPERITLLIGPEGDFHADEVRMAEASGFRPVSLGPHILRSETAGLYAVSMVNAFSLPDQGNNINPA